MRSEHINKILSESVSTGRGGRAKNLKIYIYFFKDGVSQFKADVRKNIPNGRENEFSIKVEDKYLLFFDEWPWGIVAYHSHEKNATDQIERYLRNSPDIRVPWIKKQHFEDVIQQFESDQGKVVLERSRFKPFNDFAGYGITIHVRGERTKEVIESIESNYSMHPYAAGLETGGEDDFVKFEMTNSGRLSFHQGKFEGMIYILNKYIKFLLNKDEDFEFEQSRQIQRDNVYKLQTNEIFYLDLPSIEKLGTTREKRNNAIFNMLTMGMGVFGYIGIPISKERINLLDLTEKKTLLITLYEDRLYIHSKNPSKVRSTLRRLVENFASYIDPEVSTGIMKTR